MQDSTHFKEVKKILKQIDYDKILDERVRQLYRKYTFPIWKHNNNQQT